MREAKADTGPKLLNHQLEILKAFEKLQTHDEIICITMSTDVRNL